MNAHGWTCTISNRCIRTACFYYITRAHLPSRIRTCGGSGLQPDALGHSAIDRNAIYFYFFKYLNLFIALFVNFPYEFACFHDQHRQETNQFIGWRNADLHIYVCTQIFIFFCVQYMIVIRTITLKLHVADEDIQSLLQTMREYTYAFDVCSEWGFKNHSYNKVGNHNATYRNIRSVVPKLPSSLVQCARDCACDALKAVKCKHQPTRNELSAIRYNSRVIRVNFDMKHAMISTSNGRIRGDFVLPAYYQKYSGWYIKSSTISFRKRDKTFYLGCQVESNSQPPTNHKYHADSNPILGIDRGIVNIAVCSDNTFYNSKKVKNTRAKYAKLRAELQSKGTRSAKRKLRELSGRERRFVTDVNHCISKHIVQKPHTTFALEDLSKIRVQNRRKGRDFNRKLNNWAFYELEQFIRYKSENVGKSVVFVDARFTSQKCSKCGHVHKSNRNASDFKCKKCGFNLHADLNASRNIAHAGISCMSRLHVNQPNVACFKHSHKPTNLFVGS